MYAAVRKVDKAFWLQVGLSTDELKQFCGNQANPYDVCVSLQDRHDGVIQFITDPNGKKIRRNTGRSFSGSFLIRTSNVPKIVSRSVRQRKIHPKVIRRGSIEIDQIPSDFTFIPLNAKPEPKVEVQSDTDCTLEDLFGSVEMLNECIKKFRLPVRFNQKEDGSLEYSVTFHPKV